MKPELFLDKIREEFPKLEWKHHRILTNGYDHIVAVLDEKIIFRASKENPKDIHSTLYDESRLLHYLKKKLSVGVPEYSLFSRDRSFGGYEMLTGEELSPARFKLLNSSEKELFARYVACFLTVLHSTPSVISKKFNVRDCNPQQSNKRFIRNTRKLFPRLTRKNVLELEELFDDLKETLGNKHCLSLIHNDLTWEHILWDGKKKKVNIIDFADRVLGDSAIDFMGLWEFGDKLPRRVYELYRGKKDENFIYRSQLYYKRLPLLMMKDSLDGFPCAFKEGHELFRKLFKT